MAATRPDRSSRGEILWTPAPDAWATSRLGRFLRAAAVRHGFPSDDYLAAWRWSIEQPGEFWSAIWNDYELGTPTDPGRVLVDDRMPGAQWFPDARTNYAEVALRGPRDAPALVALSQSRDRTTLTYGELAEAVGRCQRGLQALGVGIGDRVAAYLPNAVEAVVAMLATAGLGAVWASCAPEFGPKAVTDRLGPLRPKVLLATDGYRYGDKLVDRRDDVEQIRQALDPSVRVVTVLHAALGPHRDSWDWERLLAEPGVLSVEPVRFDHPLFVLFSSGTTGPPKAIVHTHGGITLEHVKALSLHHDLGPGDTFFWYTTTAWMMWNYLLSGLLVGARVVLYDGHPTWPDAGALWAIADEEEVAVFGASAPYLMACRAAGVQPRRIGSLEHLRAVGSTGSALPAEGFRWIADGLGSGVQLASVSGGTDVCSCFVGSSPVHPVRAGEISCAWLGVAARAYDADGRPLMGETGELVVERPLPSMPSGFWGDDDGARYRTAYFERYPGRWTHGDWILFHDDGSCVISGRSDATLNRGGVRIGSAEVYAVVDATPGVRDSLVVHLEDDGAGKLVLFVALDGTSGLTDVQDVIRRGLRQELSPRHVPDEIVEVPAVPRTLTGKRLEIPVKRILLGAAASTVADPTSLEDPTALDHFEALRDTVGAGRAP